MKKHHLIHLLQKWIIVSCTIVLIAACIVTPPPNVNNGDNGNNTTNKAPTFDIVTQTDTVTTSATMVGQAITATDPDGDALTWSLSATRDGTPVTGVFSIPGTTNTRQVNAAGLIVGNYVVTISVNDGINTATSIINLRVSNTVVRTGPPGLNITNQNATVFTTATTVGKAITATDPDGDALTWSISATRGGTPVTGVFSIPGTTNTRQVNATGLTVGEYVVTVSVTDGKSAAVTSTINVTVITAPQNNTPPRISTTTRTFTKDENTTGVVGTVLAEDNEENSSTLRFSTTSTVFEITDAGVLSLKSGETLDHEDQDSHTIQVLVTDSGGLIGTANISITINDVNEAPSITTPNNTNFPARPGSDADKVLAQIHAEDPDDGDSLTFEITSQPTAGQFEIKKVNGIGEISLIAGKTLAESTLTLKVRVSDSDGLMSSEITITITATSTNQAPIIATTLVQTPENISATTEIVNIKDRTTDEDKASLSFALTAQTATPNGGTSASIDNFFEIDASTGIITLTDSAVAAGGLNFESDTRTYSITVTATDSDPTTPRTSEPATIAIVVTDANDPVTFGANSYTFNVPENTRSFSGLTPAVEIAIADEDGDVPTFEVSGIPAGTFFIAGDGTISLGSGTSLDFETTPSYTLTITATDGGDNKVTATTTVTVNVTDVNEAPVITSATSFSAQENIGADVEIAKITATDPENDSVSYSINPQSTLFEIDESTGVISLKAGQNLDYETMQSHSITVRATSSTPPLFTDAQITINVTDVNEAPVITSATSFSAQENIGADVEIAKITATDPENGSVSYSINPQSTLFEIDESTGVISLKAGQNLDYETMQSHSITVRATDSSTPPLFTDAQITINVTDAEVEFDKTTYTFTVTEPATTIGTVRATSSASSGNLVYEITSQKSGSTTTSIFSVNSATGSITTSSGSLMQSASPYTIVVRAKISGNNSISGTTTVTVNVTPPRTFSGTFSIPSGHSSIINSIAFSSDGTLMASGSDDDTIRVSNSETAKILHELSGHTDNVNDLAFSPDGTMLASASDDNTIRIWNPSTGAFIRELTGHTKDVLSVAFSPDGTMLASGSEDTKIRIWNSTTWNLIRELTGHTSDVISLAFYGTVLASGAISDSIRIWNPANGNLIGTINSGGINTLAVSPDGTMLASGGNLSIDLWNLTTRERIHTITIENSLSAGVAALAFNHDGTRLASGSLENKIRIWDPSTRDSVGTIDAPTDRVRSIAYSPDGTILASPAGTEVHLYNSETGKRLRTISGHAKNINSLDFSPDGTILASGSDDNTIRLWNPSTGTFIRTLTGHQFNVLSVAFSPDGTMLASGSLDNTIRLWDPLTGKHLRTLSGHTDGVNTIVFSPDGTMLASGSDDNTIRIWNPATGDLIRTINDSPNVQSAIAFSPDGTILAAGKGSIGDINLWNPRTGMKIRTLTGNHTIGVVTIAFSPDGKMIATGSLDNTISLWNPATGTHIRKLTGHTDDVFSLGFSPDGSSLMSGGADKNVIHWNPADGTLVRTLTGHTENVLSLAFSSGNIFASGSADRSIFIWNSSTN